MKRDAHDGARCGAETHGLRPPFLRLLPLLLGISALLVGAARAAAPCREDGDCKLIYSSCLCEAVPASDSRVSLPSEVDCAANRCRVEHTRAVCRSGECAKESDPVDASPPRR